MNFRVSTEADADQILTLQTQIYRVEKIAQNSKEVLINQMKNNSCIVLVGENKGKIIASGVIYLIDVPVRGKPYAFLEGIVVDEKERGKGIGTNFFEEIITLCKNKNCYKILFTSGADRTDAHKFYEKMGFKKWGLEFRLDL